MGVRISESKKNLYHCGPNSGTNYHSGTNSSANYHCGTNSGANYCSSYNTTCEKGLS